MHPEIEGGHLLRHVVDVTRRQILMNRQFQHVGAQEALRFRDRAVVDYAVSRIAEEEGIKYENVRGVFIEGKPAFPGSKIALKSHIQIAVRDPACILRFFRPGSS